jgi:hypothetical protein
MSIFSRTKSALYSKSWTVDHPTFGQIHFSSSKRISRLRISVKPFLGIQVLIPVGLSQKKANIFIEKKSNWIKKALSSAHQTEEKSLAFFSSQELKPLAEIRMILTSRLSKLASANQFSYNKVSIRDQKSRWGSCSHENNISLNQKLYYLPDDIRDYVLLHELAHTIQKNHSNRFWDILHQILGINETAIARKELRSFEFLFYPPPKSTKKAPIKKIGA